MITSEVKTFSYASGEIQRVQVVRSDSFDDIDFVRPVGSRAAFEQFCNIYRNYLVPAAPMVFGRMILFYLPNELIAEFGSDAEARVHQIFSEDVRINKDGVSFESNEAKGLWEMLEKRGCVQTVCGKLPFTKTICVGNNAGFLTESTKQASAVVNASFFIMDPFDCATKYDKIGTAFGLAVKDGFISSPPLFGREAFLVDNDGNTSVREVYLSGLRINIGHVDFMHGVNAEFFERPARKRTSNLREDEQDIVIVGTRVADVVSSGHTDIPASGWVMRVHGKNNISVGDTVVYHGLDNIRFGIQVGNSVMRDGEMTAGFVSKFYNIKKPWTIEFPPSMYPLSYERDRAARIAIGADIEGHPMLVWAEGAGKLRYVPGEDSCGASLSELACICRELNMYNGVSLDGGGSAQILVNGTRSLMISDRDPKDNSSAERAVPLGIKIG